MAGWRQWPFSPCSLSEIIEPETLAAIESGLSERIGRPLTILDMDPETGQFTRRIESIHEMRRYEEFCQKLRETEEGNQLCLAWDRKQAKISLETYRQYGDPYRCFRCHAGLADMTFFIRIHNRPVAMLFTGQYCPEDGRANIHQKIDQYGSPGHPRFPVQPQEKVALHALADKLPLLPDTARAELEKQAQVIQRFAEAEFQMLKRQKEQKFLDELRLASSGPKVQNRADLEQRLLALLQKVQAFLRCKYTLFFGALQEDDTVLTTLAFTGLSGNIDHRLPHFNWRKASLPLENFDLSTFSLLPWLSEARAKGIRGENRELLVDAAMIIPVSLGDRWRGALLLGPLEDEVDLSREERFLKEVASTLGLVALTSAEVLYLEQERRWWHNTARLLTHQFKTGLTPIATDLGWAGEIVRKPARDIDFKQLENLLNRAEDLSMRLAESARETLNGTVSLIAKNDLHIESYQLSVLVGNCVNSFINLARRENRDLEMDRSVEMLPEAEMDVARLTVAIDNLIENAVKYSYPETRILVRSHIDFSDGIPAGTHSMNAVIEVSDFGREIRQDEKDRIFELGTRGSNVLEAATTKTKLPGSGLGLWETRSIIQAHGGTIQVSCEPTGSYRRETRVFQVVFKVCLPLKQNE